MQTATRLLVLCIIVCIAAIGFLIYQFAHPSSTSTQTMQKPMILPLPSEGAYVPAQMIVEFSDGMTPTTTTDQTFLTKLRTLEKTYGVTRTEPLAPEGALSRFFTITIRNNAQLPQAMEDYGSLPGVKSISPNGIKTSDK